MYLFFVVWIINPLFLFAIQQTDRPSILVNPSGSTPLSAFYILPEINQEEVVIIVQGKTPDMTISVKYPKQYGKRFPIHGLYEDHQNFIFIRNGNNKFQKYQINTTLIPIPSAKKAPPIDRTKQFLTSVKQDLLESPKHFQQDLFFVSLPLNGCIIGYDRKGDIRYYYYQKGVKAQVIRMMCEDNCIYFLMIDNYRYYQKMDLFGNCVFREQMNVHHESVPFINRQELILGNSTWGWEDMVFVLDSNHKIVKQLSIGDAIRKVVDQQDISLLNQVVFDNKNVFIGSDKKKKRIDWAHANSLVYDSHKDLLYISLRHLGIVAIKFDEWQLEWFITSDSLKISEGVRYGEKPAGSKFLIDIPSLQKYRMYVKQKACCPKGQHALFLTKHGNLMFFDNQADLRKNPQGSRILEYQINKESKVANTTFLYQTPEKTYSRLVSDVDITGSNYDHLLILFGFSRPNKIIELDNKSNILYHLEIKTDAMFYRIDKFPLYPYIL